MATALKGLKWWNYNYFPIFPVVRLLLVQTEETNLRQKSENNPWEMHSALACDCYRPCKAPHYLPTALPRWRSSKESACLSGRCKRWGFDPSSKIPWSRKWQPIPVFLPGKFHEQRSLVGYSPWGHKKSDTTEQQIPSLSHVSTDWFQMYLFFTLDYDFTLCYILNCCALWPLGAPSSWLLYPPDWSHSFIFWALLKLSFQYKIGRASCRERVLLSV